jgi:hypothetical protein
MADEDISMMPDSMLLVLPVPFGMRDGRLLVEAQAANGLDRWAENFSRVVVAAPVLPETLTPYAFWFCMAADRIS